MHLHRGRRSRAQRSLQSTHSMQTGTFGRSAPAADAFHQARALLPAPLPGCGPCACVTLVTLLPVTSTASVLMCHPLQQ